jgi:hypothetical protein
MYRLSGMDVGADFFGGTYSFAPVTELVCLIVSSHAANAARRAQTRVRARG